MYVHRRYLAELTPVGEVLGARGVSGRWASRGCPASADELSRMRSFVHSLASHYNVTGSETLSSVAVWKDVAHTFFNMKEFLYLR